MKRLFAVLLAVPIIPTLLVVSGGIRGSVRAQKQDPQVYTLSPPSELALRDSEKIKTLERGLLELRVLPSQIAATSAKQDLVIWILGIGLAAICGGHILTYRNQNQLMATLKEYRTKESCEGRMKVIVAEVGLLRHDINNQKTVLLGLASESGKTLEPHTCPKCTERMELLRATGEE